MAETCVFCEQDGKTREHIIPKWIAKHCGLRGVFLGPTTDDARRSRKQDISFQSHRRRFFCEDCQKHFGRVENDVMPLIVAMCRQQSISFDSSEQRLVARWATKTAYALIASEAGAEEVIPKSQRVSLRLGDEPPDGTWVAFALYDGPAQKDVQIWSDQRPGDAQYEPRMVYSAFLSFGRVAFKVVGVDKQWPDDVWLRLLGLTRFWPTDRDVVEWPPQYGIRGDAIKGARDLIPLAGY